MANLTETTTYELGIYQLATTDPVAGGPDGLSNLPLKQLANRTAWLKQALENLDAATPSNDGTGAYGTWNIAIGGNAGTATKLATARTINGVAFDGSANIEIDAPTKTGAGASGTWGISITGNADTVDGLHGSQFLRSDTPWSGKPFEAAVDVNGITTLYDSRFLQGNRTNSPDISEMGYAFVAAAGDTINRGVQLFWTPSNFWWRERSNNAWRKLWHDGHGTPIWTSGGTITGNNRLTFGPNSTWGAYLFVGGDGRNGLVDSPHASVTATDGTIHIDAGSGKATYVNWYDGAQFIIGAGDSSTELARFNTTEFLSYRQVRSTAASGIANNSFDTTNFEAYSDGGLPVGYGFHRGGYSGVALYHNGDGDQLLRLRRWLGGDYQIWHSGNGTPAWSSEFPNSKAGNGYQKLPGGLILQWGSIYAGDIPSGNYAYAANVTFPIAFTGAVLSVVVGKTGDAAAVSAGGRYFTTTGFQIYAEEWSGQAQSVYLNWIAIGY